MFAGIDQIEIPTLPIEYHVAEKLHAYTQTFADQRTNTRTRDLIDLVLIRSNAALSARKLREALAVTFSGRGADSIPIALPPPPAVWEQRYRILTEEVALDPDLTVGYRLAAAFLDPVLDGSVADDARWDPAQGAWVPPRVEQVPIG